MADARAKAVAPFFIDTWSRKDRLHNLLRDIGEVNRFGDIIDLPQQATPTDTSPTTRAAAETLTPTITALTADQEIFYNIRIPKREAQQLINGSWPMLTGEAAAGFMQNAIDLNLINYLTLSLAYDSSATYHDNVAADSLTDNDLALSEAAMLAQDGVQRENLAWVVSSYGMGSLRQIADYVPGFVGSEQGRLGIPAIGSVNGIPVYQSNGILRNRTIATTAAVTTGSGTIHTYTVASGHGVVPGQLVTVAGHDADENISTATAVTSVTATTVVVTTAATTDGTSGDASGTITIASSDNLLIDRANLFIAKQLMPSIEYVKDYESAMSAIQFYTLFGRAGIAGRVRVLHSPGSNV